MTPKRIHRVTVTSCLDGPVAVRVFWIFGEPKFLDDNGPGEGQTADVPELAPDWYEGPSLHLRVGQTRSFFTRAAAEKRARYWGLNGATCIVETSDPITFPEGGDRS